MFAHLVAKLWKAAPQVKWHALMENVASMSVEDRVTITEFFQPVCPQPYWVDAAIMGQTRRPRLY